MIVPKKNFIVTS